MKFLKYTTYDIQKLVIDKMSNFKDIKSAGLEFDISTSELELFYKELHFFTPKMYENASKILDISIEELTEVQELSSEEIVNNIKYRESIKKNDNKNNFIDKEVDKGLQIFKEIIDIYKLNGGE